MTQRLKVVPSSVAYDIAGDYFQALRHITAPAALMVRQQSSLIITPDYYVFYSYSSNYSDDYFYFYLSKYF